MNQALSKLTIICPPAGADRMTQLMSDNEPPIFGFARWNAETAGFDFGASPSVERVQKRDQRCIFVAILNTEAAIALVKNIVDKAEIAHLAYWIEAVIAFGELRPNRQASVASRPETPEDLEDNVR